MHNFDYDEWPTNSTCNEFIQRPYFGSAFDIRSCFNTIFPEDKFKEVTKKSFKKREQVYKIKYSLNLLPKAGLHVKVDSG